MEILEYKDPTPWKCQDFIQMSLEYQDSNPMEMSRFHPNWNSHILQEYQDSNPMEMSRFHPHLIGIPRFKPHGNVKISSKLEFSDLTEISRFQPHGNVKIHPNWNFKSFEISGYHHHHENAKILTTLEFSDLPGIKMIPTQR